MSNSSTDTTAFTTSKNTSPYSQRREEEEKQTDKTVIARSCTSLLAKDKPVSDEQTNFDKDRCSAPGDACGGSRSDHRIQNDFDDPGTPAKKSDLSAQPTNSSPPPAPAKQTTQTNSDACGGSLCDHRTDEAAMRSPALESPARTQLLTKLSSAE